MSTLLTVTIFLPLFGSLILFFMPMWSYRTARQFALVTSLITFALSVVLLLGFRVGGPPGYQFATSVDWLSVGDSAIKFTFGLDGISLCLMVMSSLLVVPSIFASWESSQVRTRSSGSAPETPAGRSCWSSCCASPTEDFRSTSSTPRPRRPCHTTPIQAPASWCRTCPPCPTSAS